MALALLGCGSKPTLQTSPRYAVLRFENLSGDSSLEWICRALQESLPLSLNGALDGPVLPSDSLARTAGALGPRPGSAPGISTGRGEAIMASANRIIVGYVEKNGGVIRIRAIARDLVAGKTVRDVVAEGSSAYAAIDGITKQLSPKAKPPIAQNANALENYAKALEAPPAQSRDLLNEATTLDPTFGAAWVSRVSVDLQLNDRPSASRDIEQAQQQKLDDVSRAKLAVDQAELSGDRAQVIAATRKLSALMPADVNFRRALAELETSQGNFKDAAADWQQIASQLPLDPLAWNSLGYARSYAGDFAGAMEALRRYDQLNPKEANPQDSIGDIDFAARKFTDAAAHYLEAHKRQPQFEGGGDLYKAAWAKLKAGDRKGADALFDQYKAERTKVSKELADLIAGVWLYSTGRQAAGIDTVRTLAGTAENPSVRSEVLTQLAVWELMAGNRAQAAKDAAAIPNGSSAAVLARFAALPSASAEEWEHRAQPLRPSIRDLAVGYALLLDGKRDAAVNVWKRIADQSPATDFFARAVYAHLEGRSYDRALLPEPNNLNPFAGVLNL